LRLAQRLEISEALAGPPVHHAVDGVERDGRWGGRKVAVEVAFQLVERLLERS
jgi:hypothetical protein